MLSYYMKQKIWNIIISDGGRKMSKIKNLKFIIILFVTILAFGFSSCYAVDLDLSEDLTTNWFFK